MCMGPRICQFLSDFKLVDNKSKFCKQSDLDTLFITIDSLAARVQQQHLKEEEEMKKGHALTRKDSSQSPLTRQSSSLNQTTARTARFDDKKMKFSSVEFVTALVNIAIKKYIETKEMSDVSEAVARLMHEDIIPKLRKAQAPPAEFRLRHLYSQKVSEVLSSRLNTLRAVFDGLVSRGKQRRHKLINIGEWLAFLRAAALIGTDLSERDSSIAFAWSRMCVTDARTELGHLRQECLPFEGFLEALCRISALKALPNDSELEKSKASSGAAYLEELRQSHFETYQMLLKDRGRPWGSEPAQPLHRCIEHLISMIVHAIVPTGAEGVSSADMRAWMDREMSGEEERSGRGG